MRLIYALLAVWLIWQAQAQTTPTVQVKTVADMIALQIPIINNRFTAIVTGRNVENDHGGGTFYFQTNVVTATNLGTIFKPAVANGRWIRDYSGPLNVRWFGAKGDGTNNDAVAIQAAIDLEQSNGGGVYIPTGNYLHTSPIALNHVGILIQGEGSVEKWGQSVTNRPTKLSYVGTDAAIKFAGNNVQSCTLQSLQFDGSGASGSAHGIFLNGTNECTNLKFIDTTVNDFPGHQVYCPVSAATWGISFTRCNFHDRSRRLSDNLVQFDGTTSTTAELSFFDCLFQPYTAGKWGAKLTATSIMFSGGTITTVGENNGAWLAGGGEVYGTHFEGNNGATTNNIGVRLLGALGFKFQPGLVATFHKGVQIGDPTAKTSSAEGIVIDGAVGGNTVDIQVIDGGSRWASRIDGTGRFGGGPVIQDDQLTIDGLAEVSRSYGPFIDLPNGTQSAPSFSFVESPGSGMYYDRNDTTVRIGRQNSEQLRIGNDVVTTIHDAQVNNDLTVFNNIHGKIIDAGDKQFSINSGYHTDASQFQVHAGNGINGIVSIQAYDTNNMNMMFGAHMSNLLWFADSATVAGFYKLDGVFDFIGNTGLTLGQNFTPSTNMELNLATGTLTTKGQFGTTLATGTAPFAVASTTMSPNLNADLLDDHHGAYYLDLGNATGNLGVSHLNSGTSASGTTFWRGDGTWGTPAGSGGTVTSVAMSVPSFLSIAGSPITTSGTLAVTLSGTKLPLANESSPTGTGIATATSGAWDAATSTLGTGLTNRSGVISNNITAGSGITLTEVGSGKISIAATGGGSGTVTSVGLAGTAAEIAITGSTPITTSGSWTASFAGGHTGTGKVVEEKTPTFRSGFTIVRDSDGTIVGNFLSNDPLSDLVINNPNGTLFIGADPGGSPGIQMGSGYFNMLAGQTFGIASGANQRAGNLTLIGGTKTTANTTVSGSTIVMLTRKTSGGTIGTAITYTVSAGASFTVNSDNILDTSTFSYLLIEVP